MSPACSSASAACEAVRLVTSSARASSARVRGPSPQSRFVGLIVIGYASSIVGLRRQRSD